MTTKPKPRATRAVTVRKDKYDPLGSMDSTTAITLRGLKNPVNEGGGGLALTYFAHTEKFYLWAGEHVGILPEEDAKAFALELELDTARALRDFLNYTLDLRRNAF
jgi:hypothetical protein